MLDTHNYYYDMLKLGLPVFSEKLLRKQYRETVKEAHPDKPTGSHEMFKHISEANNNLKTINDITKNKLKKVTTIEDFYYKLYQVNNMTTKEELDTRYRAIYNDTKPLTNEAKSLLDAGYKYLYIQLKNYQTKFILSDNVFEGINQYI